MTRVMTYDELAVALGITRDSARQLVQRKRWMRRKGNDGKARIEVPVEALEAVHRGHDPALEAPHKADNDPPHPPPHEAGAIQALTRVIEVLQEEIAELHDKASKREDFAAQVAALQAMLDEARSDRDRYRSQAECLEGELVELRTRVSERDVLLARVETETEALRSVVEEARADRNRWAAQAHALVHPPAPPVQVLPERRSLFGWFRRAG